MPSVNLAAFGRPGGTSAWRGRVTTAGALIARLQEHGVSQAFGIPGTHNIPLYRELARCGIPHVSPRHEQGAGYAADGYARTTGKPALCVVTTGPGVTNIMTAAANAEADSVAMVIAAPGLPVARQGQGTGDLHDSRDQFGAMARLVSIAERVCSPLDAVRAVDTVFARLEAGRPRPAYLELPIDHMESTSELTPYRWAVGQPPRPDSDTIRQAADLLTSSESVVMILGGGATEASTSATELAERLGALVVTTTSGKGVVPDDHPLTVGSTLRLSSVRERVAASDVVLAVGTELAGSDLWVDPPLPLTGELIRVDIEPAQISKNACPTIGIVGTAAETLGLLVEAVAVRRSRPATTHDALRSAARQEADGDAYAYWPAMNAIGGVLSDDTIVVGDQAQACYYGALHAIARRHPRQFLMPVAYATLGYAIPAAIGAKLAQPSKPVVALSGDGGFFFTVQELATAKANSLGFPIVVFNNGGYAEIERNMLEADVEPFGVRLALPDVVAVAKSFGARGARASTPADLASMVQDAHTRDQPTVIEVLVGG